MACIVRRALQDKWVLFCLFVCGEPVFVFFVYLPTQTIGVFVADAGIGRQGTLNRSVGHL